MLRKEVSSARHIVLHTLNLNPQDPRSPDERLTHNSLANLELSSLREQKSPDTPVAYVNVNRILET